MALNPLDVKTEESTVSQPQGLYRSLFFFTGSGPVL